MQKLRLVHLYLGCIFASMLLFFAISGIWQTFGVHSEILGRLSTIHTSHQLKTGHGLSSFILMLFVVVMAISFIITTLLGVALAVKSGRNRRVAYGCLAVGVLFPQLVILLKAFS